MGKLIFLLHTRPDLSFTTQFLSQFNNNHCQIHFEAALHVLKYLKGTIFQGIFLNNKDDFKLETFVIPIGHPVQQLEGQSVVSSSQWEGAPFHGNPRNKLQSLCHQLKQSIDP